MAQGGLIHLPEMAAGIAEVSSSRTLVWAPSHGGLNVPGSKRGQTWMCKQFSSLCLYHVC